MKHSMIPSTQASNLGTARQLHARAPRLDRNPLYGALDTIQYKERKYRVPY